MNAYIVEIFTAEAHKIYFVHAETRGAAIKEAKKACGLKSIKPALGRDINDARCDRMLSEKEFDMTDLRKKEPQVATRANRQALGALVGM